MNGGQVFAMFRSFADESDATFLTDGNVSTYLEQGYQDFRNKVISVDPSVYLTRATINSGTGTTNFIDLAATTPAYLGSTAAAGTKIDRLLRVARVGADGLVLEYLDASPSELALGVSGYCLSGTRLVLGNRYSGTYRLEYIPTVDFTNFFTETSTQYIDDLESFHVLIPLLALRYYSIRDGGTSPEVERQISAKIQELNAYLTEGRNQDVRFVQTTDYNY